MKTLNEFYKEILNDENLRKEYSTLETDEQFAAFLKNHDCGASIEEAKTFVDEGGEIADDDLDIAGGGSCTSYDDYGQPIVTWGNTCDHYRDSSGRKKEDSPGSCTCFTCTYKYHKTELVTVCRNPIRVNN